MSVVGSIHVFLGLLNFSTLQSPRVAVIITVVTHICRQLIKAIMMTASDLCASTKSWRVQLRMVKIIIEEFYLQVLARRRCTFSPPSRLHSPAYRLASLVPCSYFRCVRRPNSSRASSQWSTFGRTTLQQSPCAFSLFSSMH